MRTKVPIATDKWIRTEVAMCLKFSPLKKELAVECGGGAQEVSQSEL